MIIFGYAIQHKYSGDGTLMVQVRIPNIHGAFSQIEYRGSPIRNYVKDDDLPWYPGLLSPYLPNKGDVVALTPFDEGKSDFLVLGLTGGSYYSGGR